jgi:hypothetical protein
LREKSNLLKRINVICPVQSPLQKYFCFSEIEIRLRDLPSRPERGALAIVTNVGAGSSGRGSARAQIVIAGRIFRERSDGTQTNGTAAYGKIVWS